MKKRHIVLLLSLGYIASSIGCICAREYIAKPYQEYDNDLWESGRYKEYHAIRWIPKVLANRIPDSTQVTGYSSFRFYICQYTNSFLRRWFEQGCISDNACLELKYSPENYKKAENDLFIDHTFLEEPVWTMPITSLKLGDYTVKFVAGDEMSVITMAHSSYFIAYNGIDTIRYCIQDRNSNDMELANEEDFKLWFLKGFEMEW